MSDDDAEWIDVNKEFGGAVTPKKPGGPNNPAPRPTTPRTTTLPEGGPKIPGKGQDAPERVPPSQSGSTSNATVISVSVVSCFVVIALVLVVLYLLVLKKKLRKVEKSKADSQFCLRVEDVAHLDIDENASLYVNTTDLQKLVSTVRLKNKREIPPIPGRDGQNFPEVVRVNKPVANKGVENFNRENLVDEPFEVTVHGTSSGAEFNSGSVSRPKCPPPGVPMDRPRHKPTEASPIKAVRTAPPPPIKQDHCEPTKTITKTPPPVYSLDEYCEPDINIVQVDKNSSMGPPLTLPKHAKMVNGFQQEKPAPLVTSSKPKPPVGSESPKPVAPSVALKPKLIGQQQFHSSLVPPPVSQKPKPLLPNHALPLLKMNLLPTIDRQDSGFSNLSTPGTAASFLSDSTDASLGHGLNAEYEPANMSVTAKRAFLENAISMESLKRS